MNTKALGLSCRKSEKWNRVSLLEFQYLLNLWHSWRMCCLDSMGYKPHRQLKISEGKNLNRYSPIGAWLVIALDAWVQSKFEWLNYKSHGSPLEHEDSMGSKSSLNRLRKFLSLESDIFDVMVSNHLIYTAMNSKELSFSCGNIDSSESFDNRFVKGMNV